MNKTIQKLRREAGLTQEELAKELGLKSASAVTMWEAGTRKPRIETLRPLAAALGVTIDELLMEDGQD